jgi:hypothetical protein
MSDELELLRQLYALFNGRDVESVPAAMRPGVVWANGMEVATSKGAMRCAAIGDVNGRTSIRT